MSVLLARCYHGSTVRTQSQLLTRSRMQLTLKAAGGINAIA
jgi:hypothetical protein